MRKLLVVGLLAFLLMASVVDQTEAVPPVAWFAAIAAKLAVRLVKKMYYARCNTRYVPSGINCPGVVYGVGVDRNSAQNSARFYASKFGDSACARYVGHCQIYKFK